MILARIHFPSFLASMVLISACGVVDDGTDCTEMGCEDGLNIALAGPGVAKSGAYEFVLIADGEEITRTANLPVASCENAGGAPCTSKNVFLSAIGGCGSPDTTQSFDGIILSGMHPRTVEVTVRRDGAEVAHQTFTLSYTHLEPNGPDCPGACDQASTSLGLQ